MWVSWQYCIACWRTGLQASTWFWDVTAEFLLDNGRS
jgi:hypothetical protein